jgi:endonuclease/exonuclease/phosphatase family metal-dependent hydrolase
MIGLTLWRGWCSVDVATRGEDFRYICTHLEEETAPEIQRLQGQELLSGPANVRLPVVLVGDFNADSLGRNGAVTYGDFIDAGFNDAWLAVHRHSPAGGLTWGHDDLLADPSHPFSWRIDLILYRGAGFVTTGADVLDPRLHRAQAPFWASDHAAVAADFLIERPRFPHEERGFGEPRR